MKLTTRFLLVSITVFLAVTTVSGQNNDGFVHDAEYFILQAQNGEKWSAEDKDIDKKLIQHRE